MHSLWVAVACLSTFVLGQKVFEATSLPSDFPGTVHGSRTSGAEDFVRSTGNSGRIEREPATMTSLVTGLSGLAEAGAAVSPSERQLPSGLSKSRSSTRLAARPIFKQTGGTARLDRILRASPAGDVDESSTRTFCRQYLFEYAVARDRVLNPAGSVEQRLRHRRQRGQTRLPVACLDKGIRP